MPNHWRDKYHATHVQKLKRYINWFNYQGIKHTSHSTKLCGRTTEQIFEKWWQPKRFRFCCSKKIESGKPSS